MDDRTLYDICIYITGTGDAVLKTLSMEEEVANKIYKALIKHAAEFGFTNHTVYMYERDQFGQIYSQDIAALGLKGLEYEQHIR